MNNVNRRATLFCYHSDIWSLGELDWLMEQDCIKRVVPVVDDIDDVRVFVFTSILMSSEQMDYLLKEWKINHTYPITASCVRLKEVIFG